MGDAQKAPDAHELIHGCIEPDHKVTDMFLGPDAGAMSVRMTVTAGRKLPTADLA
jgi:hypothetical protein